MSGRVTIITYTQFGPYQTESTLQVSPQFAQNLVNQYGRNVRIVSNYPGTFWFQNGAVLRVYPQSRPQPQPPTPTPGTINVRFINEVEDPVSGQVYNAGPLYRFTVSGLRTLNSRVGGLLFASDPQMSNTVPVSQLDSYVGQTLFVDQAIYAFRAPNGNGLPSPFR